MKRMLINATQEEELRMAMVDGQRLFDLNIELPSGERKKANIYKGKITRIEPSLEAAFVDYGAERHGFLPLKEISSEYFVKPHDSGGKPNIRELLQEGQDIVIQIDKEERGNKGAALTTYVSLAGRFIVLKPNKARSGGVSRRIVGEERDLARKSLKEIDVPKGMSVILRTAGIDRGSEEFAWDLQNLLAVWETIKRVVVERPSPFLIYRESNAVVRALRDYMTNEIGEILIDDEPTYKEAVEFVEQVMPHNLRKLKHYSDPVPLFTRYQIESQIESAFAHSVNLPSGGSLVIDHTEALVSIDINSARATKGGDIEATALNTNLEAADEVARQLRLRDLGGLVVIDFIDMGPQRNQREVENRLRDAARQDRARVQIGKISRFGLLEMSRQRLRPSLGESSYLVCPRCSGIGNIRSVESLALAILRIIGEEARKERTAKVIAQLPVEVATYLLNEKRDWVQNVEARNDTQVVMIANPALETPHYIVRRVRDDQVELPENSGLSYTLAEGEDEPEITQTMTEQKQVEVAAIATLKPSTPAPARPPAKTSEPGLWQRFLGLFGDSDEEKDAKKRSSKNRTRNRNDSRRRGDQRSRRKKDSQRSSDGRQNQRGKKTQNNRSKKTAKHGNEKNTQSNRGNERQEKQTSSGQAGRDDNRSAGKKRRSRGGRRRRRTNEQQENRTDTENTNLQQSEQVKADSKPAEKPKDEKSSTKNDGRKKTAAPRKRAPKKAAAETPKTAPKAKDSTDSATTEKPTAKKPETAKAEAAAPTTDNTQSATPTLKPVDAAAKPQKANVSKAESSAPPKPKAEPAKPPAAVEPRPAEKLEQTAKPAAAQERRAKPATDKPVDTKTKVEAKPAPEKSAPPKAPVEKKSVADAGNGSAKPEGSLLPWEPSTPVSPKSTDSEATDR